MSDLSNVPRDSQNDTPENRRAWHDFGVIAAGHDVSPSWLMSAIADTAPFWAKAEALAGYDSGVVGKRGARP